MNQLRRFVGQNLFFGSAKLTAGPTAEFVYGVALKQRRPREFERPDGGKAGRPLRASGLRGGAETASPAAALIDFAVAPRRRPRPLARGPPSWKTRTHGDAHRGRGDRALLGLHGVRLPALKKQVRRGESIVHTTTDEQHLSDHATARILALLDGDPRPDALILIALRPAPAVIAACRSAGLPVVIIDEEAPDASTVATDNVACGKLAAGHLLATGRRSIAVVSGPPGRPGGYSSALRLRGFREVVEPAGLELAADDVVEAPDFSRQNGVAAMNALLDRGRRVDGVFCAAGDAAAVGMLEAARARRVNVPDDVAILSCDDVPLAALADPPLSSIRQPIEALAREAYRLAADARAELLAKPQRVLFPPTLVRRRSA